MTTEENPPAAWTALHEKDGPPLILNHSATVPALAHLKDGALDTKLYVALKVAWTFAIPVMLLVFDSVTMLVEAVVAEPDAMYARE
jgi:hypothetical protein